MKKKQNLKGKEGMEMHTVITITTKSQEEK
jgi:hypothetical protein